VQVEQGPCGEQGGVAPIERIVRAVPQGGGVAGGIEAQIRGRLHGLEGPVVRRRVSVERRERGGFRIRAPSGQLSWSRRLDPNRFPDAGGQQKERGCRAYCWTIEMGTVASTDLPPPIFFSNFSFLKLFLVHS